MLEKGQIVFDSEDIYENPIYSCLQKLKYYAKYDYDSVKTHSLYKKKIDEIVIMIKLLNEYHVNITYFYDIELNKFYVYDSNRKEELILHESIKNKISSFLSTRLEA
jgi:hypothetical protein